MAGTTEFKQLKCKTCGEPLDLNTAQDGVIRCAVCDSCFTLPKKEALPEVVNFLKQGEHDLDTGRFDDAHAAYAKAAELDKTEPEAYWGMALAECRIQYLKDEANNRLQPICHEITDKDFEDNSNFLKALRYATDAQSAEYERKGKEINYIKDEFFKLAQSGLDYDCFICVKVSDENGGRTQDYKIADDIYFELKGKGYKPFFSERELSGVTGADYEARILYALYSSECMLVVCFDEAYLRTKWVKNEYSRFLKLVNDEEKESDSIALVFGNRPVEKLPNRHGKIQGIAVNSLSAMERIVSFVDNHTPEAKRRREEAVRRREEEAKRKERENEELRNELAELKKMFLNQQEARKAEEEAKRKAEEERAKREAEERAKKEAEEKARKEREAAELKAKKQAEEKAKKEAAAAQSAAEAKQKKVPAPAPAKQTPAKPAPTPISDFVIENGVLKKYKGNSAEVVIPEGVKEIGENAFSVFINPLTRVVEGCGKLACVSIPKSVTKIGEFAFNNCYNLKSITLTDSLTEIGQSAFKGSGLTSITIPKNVSKISGNPVGLCQSLESITVDKNNAYYKSENNCLLTKDGKTLVAGCKNSVIPNGVMRIGAYAFFSCGISDVTLPEGLKEIGEGAFYGQGDQLYVLYNKIESIVIPLSVEKIGEKAFWCCQFDLKIYCRAAAKPAGWDKNWDDASLNFIDLDNPNKFKNIIWGYKGDIAAPVAQPAPAKPAPVKPVPAAKPTPAPAKAVPTPAKQAPAKNPTNSPVSAADMLGFNIKNGELISYIGNSADVVIPDGVTNIGYSAFNTAKSKGLKSVTIPKSVTMVWANAFSGCKDLYKIIVDEANTTFKTDGNCLLSKDGSVLVLGCVNSVVPRSVTKIGRDAFHGRNVKFIELPESVTEIGDCAFEGCNMLMEINIPQSVISIGRSAFGNCLYLNNITLPEGLKSIGYHAFSCSFKISKVVIPESVTDIGEWAFFGCNDIAIYCRAKKQPTNWHKDWNIKDKGKIFNSKHKVIWGYKGD